MEFDFFPGLSEMTSIFESRTQLSSKHFLPHELKHLNLKLTLTSLSPGVTRKLKNSLFVKIVLAVLNNTIARSRPIALKINEIWCIA